VDDTDSAIQYGSNEWSVADSTKLNTLGNFGPVYNGTVATSLPGVGYNNDQFVHRYLSQH
jgi:hypothetical protein